MFSGIWNHSQDNDVVYIDKWVVGLKGSLENVILNEDTVGIAALAFYAHNEINSIIIPNSVTIIEDWAFGFWNEEQTIYIKGYSSAPESWSEDWDLFCDAKIEWNQ